MPRIASEFSFFFSFFNMKCQTLLKNFEIKMGKENRHSNGKCFGVSMAWVANYSL